MAFLLNFQAQGVFGENEQSTQTPWRGAQCSCIGIRPALPKKYFSANQRNCLKEPILLQLLVEHKLVPDVL